MKRTMAMVVAVVFVVAGCKGKKAEEKEPAPGTGTAAGTGTGTGTASGTAAPTATGSVAITLPGGGDASLYTATLRAGVPAPLAPYQKRLDGAFETLKTVELGPDGTKLAEPAIVRVTIDNLPAGRSMSELVAVLVSADGTVEDVKIVATSGDEVQIEVTHFSFIAVAIAGAAIVALGTMAAVMRGVTEPIMRKDCARWIAHDNAKVAEIANDASKFSIDTATGDIKLDLGKPLVGKNVDQGTHGLNVEQVMAKGEGDCVNMSTLFGSMLAAKKYPVRMVAGSATYARNGKTYKGLHQWIETVIDGKAYYVDTFEPSATKLIPVAQANTELNLDRGRMCGRNPDGSPLEPGDYDPKWFDEYTDPLIEKKRQLEILKEEHRALNKACQDGTGSCVDRQTKYEEAKKLQEEINALEAAKTP